MNAPARLLSGRSQVQLPPGTPFFAQGMIKNREVFIFRITMAVANITK